MTAVWDSAFDTVRLRPPQDGVEFLFIQYVIWSLSSPASYIMIISAPMVTSIQAKGGSKWKEER